MRKKLLSCVLGAIVCGPAAFAIPFTGDVATDFTATGTEIQYDTTGDVGLPANAPVATVSGWDLDYAAFYLDRTAAELSVGLDFIGYCGDADGDGGEGTTTGWLALNGGIDLPGLALTESICIAFDFDQDGDYDIIAGVGATDGVYRVSYFTGTPLLPAFGFGGLAPHDAGSLIGPDFELALDDMGVFEDMDPLVEVCFNFLVFAGSYQDDGIGEDLLLGEVCIPPDEDVSALEPGTMDLVGAFPNPFNPATTLTLDLAQTGEVTLAVYNVNGQLVRTLVNGSMEAGHHELSFDGTGLPSGLYLARLSTAQGDQVTRLILTK